MPNNLVFVCGDTVAGERAAEPYASRGWTTHVLASEDPQVATRICAAEPMVIALDSQGDIAPALVIASAVMAQQPAFDPLMIFVGAAPDQVAFAKQQLPYALFIKPEELPWIIKHLNYKD